MNDRATKEENIIAKADDKVAKYNSKEIQLIHDMYAKNSTEEEFSLFMYTANKFGLDPLLKQIWCVKFANQVAQIYAGRDGFLEIAHRSGQFNGIKSGMKDSNTAYAEVYRKDMDNPFYVEVNMGEYSTSQALWKTKPKTMLTKVAESQALRRAFSITGIYSPEEMGQWELEAQGIKFNTEQPKAIVINTDTKSTQIQTSAYDLDPETYTLSGGKHSGKRMIDCDSNYIEWNIKKAKTSKFKQTFEKIPMDIWIEFLEVCLKIHIANKELKDKPITDKDLETSNNIKLEPVIEGLESEFANIETADEEELKMITDTFPGTVESPQSAARNRIKKAVG